ncbi:RING finger protein 207 isoform X4 [Electrophorus electricus]|uniref:RING finger protein 207 isoform X4 n=1 Tax=Electrophorus electricus TaxID=8005 RepID=UPI0015D09EDC|nr:RING finger protein 207 isoform X4 [Electrophorus electricus]
MRWQALLSLCLTTCGTWRVPPSTPWCARCAVSSIASHVSWTATTSSVPGAWMAEQVAIVSSAPSVVQQQSPFLQQPKGHCVHVGYASVVKGINALPPEDRLLKFLVDDSTDSVVQCANCDMECHTQSNGAMYYCNTCSQPLCGPCREITHKARMFSCHEIVSLAKRAKEGHRKCSLHEELYVMFSTEKKSMLCIKCFRDMQVQGRMRCMDIETAYAQGCGILDQAMLAVKELQTSAREATIQLKAMIREVRTNEQEEETAICTLFNSMQENLAERKRILLKAAQSQHEEEEKVLKEQLYYLVALLPTLQVHLLVCSAFLSLASKYDFLDMGYQLMDRLHRIVRLPHRLCPAQSSRINADFHAEFARCLASLLPLGLQRSGAVPRGASGGSLLWAARSMSCQSSCLSAMLQGPSLGYRAASRRYVCTKVLVAKDGDTPFAEHCRNYENSYRALQTEVRKLKNQVQALHRDLTKHHSLIDTDAMGEILERSLHVDGQIASQYSAVQTHRAMLQEMWEETLQRVTNEQDIYEAQLCDLLQLKQENSYLTTIARQIGPYISSIAKVKERLEPRFQVLKEHEDDRSETMMKIYEDITVNTESLHGRNDDGCSIIYNWDSNRSKNAVILQPNETPAKSTDCCRPNKQRNV